MDKKIISPPMEQPISNTPAKIEVDAGLLQKILDNQEALQKDNALLRQSVSQNKLIEAENKAKPKQMPQAFLKVFMGKAVIGWKSERAEYVYSPGFSSAPVGEILKSRYYFADGTDSGVVDQVLFTREDARLWGSIIEDKNASVIFKPERFESADQDLIKNFVMPKSMEIRKDFLNP